MMAGMGRDGYPPRRVVCGEPLTSTEQSTRADAGPGGEFLPFLPLGPLREHSGAEAKA